MLVKKVVGFVVAPATAWWRRRHPEHSWSVAGSRRFCHVCGRSELLQYRAGGARAPWDWRKELAGDPSKH